MFFRSTFARHRIRHGIRHTAARKGRRPCPCVANGRLRYMLIGYARVSKADGVECFRLSFNVGSRTGTNDTVDAYYNLGNLVRGSSMNARSRGVWSFWLLITFGLPVTSVAQQIWVDGPLRASLDSGPTDSLAPSIPEPASPNRQLWEQIIFNTYECPSPECLPVVEDRTTMVLTPATVRSLEICHPALNDAGGELLEPYATETWWRTHIRRWTNVEWTGTFQLGMCDGQPPGGWSHVSALSQDRRRAGRQSALVEPPQPGAVAPRENRSGPHVSGKDRQPAGDRFVTFPEIAARARRP